MSESGVYYAMVVRRCRTGGSLTDTIEVSAVMVTGDSEADARQKISGASVCSYRNEGGELVEWRLTRIMSIDECHDLTSGDDVTGFTIQIGDLGQLV